MDKTVDIEKVLKDLVRPILKFPEEIVIEKTVDADGAQLYNITVNEADFGRVLGKGGRNANAVRTLVSAAGALINTRVRVNFDSL